ncbi:hypothetical protein IW19_20000 [Flavobacterium reichenbachii]|uniref:N-acetyltransferase domain-containing protein n=2 Tax=Flavobacterium reichenbachii TaxID=362418 RepID=A0A085ZFI5_9FLAO|nr:hypothetical protein IW19_20000 [Flavobacterium reichenbachii]
MKQEKPGKIYLSNSIFNFLKGIMYKVRNFSSASEFLDTNGDYIYANPMEHVLLINVIEGVRHNMLRVFQAFNIESEIDGTLVMVFVVDGNCLIYSRQYDEAYLDILASELPFDKLKDLVFAGDKKTIENLLLFKSLHFELEKHLVIYRCEKLNPKFRVSEGRMRLADQNEAQALIKLSLDFTEQYEGIRESPFEMKAAVEKEIREKILFVWEADGICGLAVEMNRQSFDYPEIGKLYTVPEKTGQGFASSLLYKLTEKILSEHPFCMLYTKGNNLASNRACIKAGYMPIADYARFVIKGDA